MKITTRFDYAAVPVGTPFTVRLMIGITGDKPKREMPINLSLVLDRSGSMAGEKIYRVREATKMIAGMMLPSDIFSLVIFDDKIDTLIPAAKGGDLKGIEDLIDKITPGGRTYLSGAYEEGVHQAKYASKIAISRVVLLSDGLANVGEQNRHLLADISAKYRLEGISTTTFGVGDDFDEDLMEGMGVSGGGSANVIEEPEHAAEVFRGELDTLRNLAATDCTVGFSATLPGISTLQLNRFSEKNGYWLVGDISASEEQLMVLELSLPPMMKAGVDVTLGQISVKWADFSSSDTSRHNSPESLEIPVSLRVATPEEFESVVPDRAVMVEAALLTAARGKMEARNLARDGHFDEAATLLEKFAHALESLGLNDDSVNAEIADLLNRARRMRVEREQFFTAREGKRMSYDSSMAARGKKMQLMAMKERMMRSETPAHSELQVITDRVAPGSGTVVLSLDPNETVADILSALFRKLRGHVPSRSYGRNWLLRERSTGRVLDLGTPYAKSNGGGKDLRRVTEAGIYPGTVLEVIGLPEISGSTGSNAQIDPGRYTVELSPILGEGVPQMEDKYIGVTPVCDFLAAVYYLIGTKVPPNAYGRDWILRDTTTGRVFDTGSSWAAAMRVPTDTRPLGVVGIKGGRVLQVLPMPTL